MFCCVRLARPERPLNLRPSRVFALGRWRWPLALGMLAAMLLLAGVPLANLVYKAGVLVIPDGYGPGADLVGSQVPLDHRPGAMAMPPGVHDGRW